MRVIQLFLFALLLGQSLPALAADSSCANPKATALSLLAWQQPDQTDLVQASRCLDLSPQLAPRRQELARRLKAVLDAGGHYVPVDDLPTEADYTDEEGHARLEPVSGYSDFVLVKKGDQWLIARETVERIDKLYGETFSGIAGSLRRALPESVANLQILGFYGWQYVFFLVLVILSTLAGQLTQRVLADWLFRIASRAGVKLDRSILDKTRNPITWAATGAVFLLGVPDLQLMVRASQLLLFIARTALSLALVVIAGRLVDVATDYFAGRAKLTESRMDDQVIPLASRTAKVAIWLLGLMFVVQNMGLEIASLLAGVSIGGVAVALAAQDTVANLFGSVMIFLDRPFQIGDWVVLDSGTEGVIEEVGFRSTRIRTFYGSLVSVPNGKVATARVDNMGRRSYRRVKATLGLTYKSSPAQVEEFVAKIRAYLKDNPAVWDGTLEVHFTNFGDSALEILVYFFLDVPDWSHELDEKAKCLLTFMKLAEEVGVSFAFPSRSIYLEQGEPPA